MYTRLQNKVDLLNKYILISYDEELGTLVTDFMMNTCILENHTQTGF